MCCLPLRHLICNLCFRKHGSIIVAIGEQIKWLICAHLVPERNEMSVFYWLALIAAYP